MLNLKLSLSYLDQARKTFRNWPLYLLENRFFRRRILTYRLREGVSMCSRSRTDDIGTIFDVWQRRAYNPSGHQIGVGDTVFDIGAHIGAFTVFASACARNGKVYSFEPVPENYIMLRRNLELNRIRNVVALEEAVTESDGVREIFLSSGSNLSHSFHPDRHLGTDGGKLKVTSRSLDTIVRDLRIDNIDFLKLNCEGSEYGILYGCLEGTLGKIRSMSIQYHDIDESRNGKSLVEFLEQHGFVVRNTGSSPFRILYAHRAG